MKKMKFPLPKIVGLTVVAGIAAMLLATLFKVLLLASVAGIVIRAAARRIGRKRRMMQPGGMQAGQGFERMQQGPRSQFWTPPFRQGSVMQAGKTQRTSGIIPIN